jgi:prepilin-type N-terminal cleavage/methylation domain-containing protein
MCAAKITSSFVIRHPSFQRAFTLIEIMVVVAIMGMLAAVGLPSLTKALQREGMRKAVSEIIDVCASARAKAILQNQTVAVTFHPDEKSFAVEGGGPGKGATYVSSSKLPDGVDFMMLDINLQDCVQLEGARARFFPNGTSDEMTIVLRDRAEWKKITLEFATGIANVSQVDR